MNKFFLLIVLLLFSACSYAENDNTYANNEHYIVIGQTLAIIDTDINKADLIEITDLNGELLQRQSVKAIDNNIKIHRLLDTIKLDTDRLFDSVLLNVKSEENIIYRSRLNILPSIKIEKICATELCNSYSGNVVENVENKIEVSGFNASFNTIIYEINSLNESERIVHRFNGLTDIDLLKYTFENVPEEYSSYISLIKISTYKDNEFVAENIIPVKVVRPLEVKHYGKYELAEVYDPVPVTGCMIGTLGNRVEYSESTSETRQNSVSISINKTWSDSFSQGIDQTVAEGINVTDTVSSNISSGFSENENISETQTNSNNIDNDSSLTFSTDNGETWSWSRNQSETTGNSTTEGEGSTTGVNGSTTIGVSGEGSLPFLAKASGKVEVSAGGSLSWNTNSSSTNSNSNSSSTGYVSSNSSSSGRSFSSRQSVSKGESLSGTYAYGSTSSYNMSEGESQTSGRVWNMSESINSGRVVTVNDSESINETYVSSSSSSTTFSYGGYIPRGKSGVFYRQTSRYTKLSEIITYDLNGVVSSAGYISMNSWVWAPELALSDSCENLPQSNFGNATCYIPPCGE